MILQSELEQIVEEVDGVRTVSLGSLEALARRHGLSRRAAELAVLELGIVPQRYLRNIGTVGLDGQMALLRASAVVVGLGGLGGYVLEGLARMGMGRLVLVDSDVFCDHNLNRQVLSDEGRLGRIKADIARERALQINQAIEVVACPYEATRENLPALLAGAAVVVDALDRLPTRLMLQDVAAEEGVPMVHGAIAGWMGQVMTIMPGDAGLHALYGEGGVPEQGVEVQQGNPAATPMLIAAFQVHEVVKILTGKGELLRGRMLFVDAGTGDVSILQLG